MEHAEFIQKVQEYAGLESVDEATKLIDTVLKTLGERLTRREKKHLYAQLPQDLKVYFPLSLKTERFTLGEFYSRISSRASIGYSQAVVWSKAVMRVLREAVAPAELDHILSQIPAEFDEIFGRQPRTPLSPTALTTKGLKRVQRKK